MAIPDHCQNRVLMSFDRSLDQIYGFSSFDTRRVETYAWGTAAEKGSFGSTITTVQEAMQWVLSITQKPATSGGSTGADSGYSYESGDMQWDVQVNSGYDTIAGEFAHLNASNPGDPNPPGDYIQDALDATAAILADKESDCSKWFGPNAVPALKAFGEQLKQAKQTKLDPGVGIHQDDPKGVGLSYFDSSGNKFFYPNALAYRLFPRVRINSYGAFVDPSAIKIGGAPSATLESRIIQVLHEIAHLTYKPGETDPLIPTDGRKGSLSEINTETILNEHKCGEAISKYLKSSKARL